MDAKLFCQTVGVALISDQDKETIRIKIIPMMSFSLRMLKTNKGLFASMGFNPTGIIDV
jgi:hypothetical protein